MNLQSEVDAHGSLLEVSSVSYSITLNKSSKKQILRNVSFFVNPGEMCALMGASGAGKRESAYVLQDDVHYASLTVEETIRYAAWTRMPEGTSIKDCEARVALLIKMMSLDSAKDNRVGDTLTKGISGGQQKRLSIAVEIIHLPQLIFLDEPTSGLDSAIAFEVMNAVNNLSKQNRTCLSTIHQPSPDVFALFDRVILLSNGRVLYAGPVSEVIRYYGNIGYVHDDEINPAEYVINICSGLLNPNDSEFPLLPEKLETLFKEDKTIPKESYVQVSTQRTQAFSDGKIQHRHATRNMTQLKMLLHRTWTMIRRDPTDLRAGIAKNLITGCMNGIIFNNQADISQPFYENGIRTADVNSLCSLLFFTVMYNMMSNLQAVSTLCARDLIYRRELSSYSYSTFPYWFASVVTYLPVMLIFHTIYVTLTYNFCGFPSDASYFFFFYICLLMVNITAYSYTLCMAAYTGNAQKTLAIFAPFFFFLVMFSGFTITVENVPGPWKWASYYSFARWGFEGMLVNEFGRYNDAEGDEVLEDFNFEGFNKYNSLLIMLISLLGTSVLTYLAMRPEKSKLIKLQYFPSETKPVNGAKKEMESLLLEDAHTNSVDIRADEMMKSYPDRISKENMDLLLRQDTNNDGGDNELLSKGCRLSFSDVKYSVRSKQDRKKVMHLLKGVSGRAQPGEMCALMGASGAGKTTLLDILAGRKTTGEIWGDVLFNGNERDSDTVRSTSYVMQENVHIGCFTVLQTLQFAADLRMPENSTPYEKTKRINQILKMLSMEEIANSLVGGVRLRGISGGQMKRLSIGVEIINLPSLIFLDEPTTGLDSAIAFEVMGSVRTLANQNRTIVSTIHQPSPLTFSLFDKLLLLGEGKVIYFGPLTGALSFFVNSPFQFQYTKGLNPADFIISVAGSFTSSGTGLKITASQLSEYYLGSSLYRQYEESKELMAALDIAAVNPLQNRNISIAKDGFENESGQRVNKLQIYSTSTWYQVKVLFRRVALKTIREPKLVVASLMRNILMGTFFGTLFFDLQGDEYTERLSLMFFSLQFVMMNHLQIIPLIFEDRLMFYRERSAGAYGALPYWLSSTFFQIPIIIIGVTLYSVITYNMADLSSNPDNFWIYVTAMNLCSIDAFFFFQMISAIAPTEQAAVGLIPVILLITIAFSGYVVYIPALTFWIRAWAPYASFMRWSFQSMVLSQFGSDGDLSLGQEYIDSLGFDNQTTDETIPIIALFGGALAITAVLCLKFINNDER